MAKNASSFSGKYCAHLFFALAFLCAIVCIYRANSSVALEDTQLVYAQPAEYAQGWSAETPDGVIPLPEPSRPAANCLTGTLRLVNTLPQPLPGNTWLCLQTKNECVSVWLDGTLVYTYGETPQLVYGNGVGAVYNLVALPDGAGGKTVTVELTPIAKRTGFTPYPFLLGSRDGIILHLLREKLALLIVSLLLALIGICGLLLSTVNMFRRSSRAGAIFWFSLFVLLSAVWTAADSGILQFALPSKGVAYLLFGCSFYLLCTPFSLFVACVDPENSRLFNLLAAVNAVYALIRILLFVTGRLDFETALWTLHVMMGVLILITNIVLWRPIVRAKRFERPELCLAVTAFTLVAGLSLFDFYLHDKLDMQRNNYSSGFYYGILLFVFITIVGALRQTQRLRQQAFKAAFFEQRAYTDDLTGLMNVKGFDDNCAVRLLETPADKCCALIDFDVNFFSQYNANNGPAAGDALLKSIAGVLARNCRPDELCARQEADHFICLLIGDTLEEILARIRAADSAAKEDLSTRMLLLSYGVAPAIDRAMHPAALRNQALVAKRTVKGNYEKNIAIYDQRLHELQLQEVALLSGLEAALENGEYVIFLQPMIDVMSESIRGAAALVRHIGPDGSVMPAGPIIEALEHKGFVAKLDYYIFEQVCKFLRRCLSENRAVYPISGNFSRVHLYDPGFAGRIASIADRYDIPRSLVEIELTETTFLAGKDALLDTVRSLHGHGFRVAVDDFGSGYSSLNMLKDVDVDVVKLDREFLSDFAENNRAAVIIEHTIRMAQQMHITTVAEGIETAEQLAFLRRIGCDLVQGYYYSKPLPEDAFLARYFSKPA